MLYSAGLQNFASANARIVEGILEAIVIDLFVKIIDKIWDVVICAGGSGKLLRFEMTDVQRGLKIRPLNVSENKDSNTVERTSTNWLGIKQNKTGIESSLKLSDVVMSRLAAQYHMT